MKVFAIADPHLSLGIQGKSMEVFGEVWKGHPEVMAARWREEVGEGDLVLVAGDISWAMRLEDARPDLEFLGGLPGRKVLIRGNHDYWWSSPSNVRGALPEGMFALQNDAVTLDGVSVAGTRLWDDIELGRFELRLRPGDRDRETGPAEAPVLVEEAGRRSPEEDERIFQRELLRLRLSLEPLDRSARLKAVMVHYPPLRPDLSGGRAAPIIEEAGADLCVFGHLHALLPREVNPLFGERNGVDYQLTSCDYLGFRPLLLAEV